MTTTAPAESRQLRPNELTTVLHRNIFDDVPADITELKDETRWRAFREEYNRASRLESFSPFPLQLDFELNSTCQLRCSFCLHGQRKVEKNFLSFELFQRAIDEGENHGLCSVKMNYINEPLLNREFPKFVDYAKSHGVLNVYFATNGLLLSEEMARELIRVRVNKIMVSLDATTPETFAEIRHSRDFDKIIKNIHGLIKLRDSMGLGYPLVRVNFLKTRINSHEAEAFIREWDDVADAIGFQEQVGIPGVENDFDASHQEVEKSFRCAFPFKLMVIDSLGNILPCCTFSGREMPMGNIRTSTIKEAWLSAQMGALKSLHLRGGFRENPICNHCVTSGGGGGSE